jgi:hypothetical protein
MNNITGFPSFDLGIFDPETIEQESTNPSQTINKTSNESDLENFFDKIGERNKSEKQNPKKRTFSSNQSSPTTQKENPKRSRSSAFTKHPSKQPLDTTEKICSTCYQALSKHNEILTKETCLRTAYFTHQLRQPVSPIPALMPYSTPLFMPVQQPMQIYQPMHVYQQTTIYQPSFTPFLPPFPPYIYLPNK